MKILLTGSEGFIGKNLQFFLKDENQLICLDKKLGNDLINCDLDYDVDLVIHLAGLSGVRQSLDNPVEYWTNNVVASYRIFNQFKNKKILYASSSTANEPWRNPYAMSKFYMEQIAPENSLGMRFTTVYGPGGREGMLIPKLIKDDVSYINVDHCRDFIHIEDLMSAIKILIKNDVKDKVLEIGTGSSINLLDLLDKLNMTIEDKRMGTMFERKDNKASIQTLKDLGWSAKTNLIDYIKNERGNYGNI
jgi:nucleoside-diphosphate-sugar epimerase